MEIVLQLFDFKMMSLRLCALVAFLVMTVPAQGKLFSRCELAKELVRLGLPKAQMGDWVCLVESESARNTAAVGGPNSNGSYDYGLFQINDNYWCSTTSTAGKDCNIKCSSLVTDDITDDVACAKIIYNRHGFLAWHGWEAKCQGALPDVSGCF